MADTMTMKPIDEGAIRGVEIIMGNKFPAEALEEGRQLQGALMALARNREAARASGRYTAEGLDVATRTDPAHAAVLRTLERFEKGTEARRAELDTAREHIESGRMVRGADGNFQVVPPRATPSAVEAIREMELRGVFRTMSRTDLHQLAIRAFRENDTETLAAIETAPRSLPVVDESVRLELRTLRFQRAEWSDAYQAGQATVAQRQQLSAKTRKALGLDGGY